MNNILFYGAIIGTAMWWGKLLLMHVCLPKWFNRWVHNSPIGLLILEICMSYLAIHAISICNATGQLVLCIMVSYGLWTSCVFLKYIIKKKTQHIYHTFLGDL